MLAMAVILGSVVLLTTAKRGVKGKAVAATTAAVAEAAQGTPATVKNAI